MFRPLAKFLVSLGAVLLRPLKPSLSLPKKRLSSGLLNSLECPATPFFLPNVHHQCLSTVDSVCLRPAMNIAAGTTIQECRGLPCGDTPKSGPKLIKQINQVGDGKGSLTVFPAGRKKNWDEGRKLEKTSGRGRSPGLYTQPKSRYVSKSARELWAGEKWQ